MHANETRRNALPMHREQACSPLAFTTILAQVHIRDEMRQADRLSKDRLPKGRGTGQTQAERGLRVTKSGKQEHKKSHHRPWNRRKT